MKKYLNFLLMSVIAIACMTAFQSCSDDDNVPQSYNLTINLDFKDGLTLDNISALNIVATNDKGQEQTIEVKAASTTITVIEGQYKLVAGGKVKDEAAAYVTSNTSVNVYSETTATVSLEKSIQSPIIFKAIYSTGGIMGYVVDQYFEIVNNSDEVQYLDGLILSSPQGKQSSANAWQASGYTDIYECGQGVVIAFPGSGKEHPLEPGQSIVLANDATNHKDLAGEGNACPDLSKADWEVYISNVNGEVDYTAPNVEIIFQNNAYMKAFGLGFFGRGYLIARCPEGMTPKQFAEDKSNIMTTPNTTSKTEYLMMPSKYVLDAVDIWDAQSTDHYGTFQANDDAQGILASTAWSGKCIRRKVSKIENGRAYYQDTNNSANDFINNADLTPGKTPTTAD